MKSMMIMEVIIIKKEFVGLVGTIKDHGGNLKIWRPKYESRNMCQRIRFKAKNFLFKPLRIAATIKSSY